MADASKTKLTSFNTPEGVEGFSRLVTSLALDIHRSDQPDVSIPRRVLRGFRDPPSAKGKEHD